MVAKYEVVSFDIDGNGIKFYLFDDADNPIEDVNKYVHSRYSNLNTQSRVINSLKHLYEFLDYKYIHPSHFKYSDFLEFSNWLKTDREHRDDGKESKRRSVHENTIATIEDDVKRYFETHIKNYYAAAVTFPKSRKRTKSDPKSKAISISDFKNIMMYMNDRDKLMFQFMYESGIRIGELFNIRVEDFRNVPRSGIDEFFWFNIYDSSNIDYRKQSKTGGRTVWIRTKLAEKIERYILFERHENKNKHSNIFTSMRTYNNKRVKVTAGDVLSYWAVYAALKKAAKQAKIEISPHGLRHSFATNMLMDGAKEIEVQHQLGHKNLSTISVYSKGLKLITNQKSLESIRAIGEELDRLEIYDV